MKKYNNGSRYYRDWTTQKLKAEAVALDAIIYEVECYGTRDMLMLAGIIKELERRGLTARTRLDFI